MVPTRLYRPSCSGCSELSRDFWWRLRCWVTGCGTLHPTQTRTSADPCRFRPGSDKSDMGRTSNRARSLQPETDPRTGVLKRLPFRSPRRSVTLSQPPPLSGDEGHPHTSSSVLYSDTRVLPPILRFPTGHNPRGFVCVTFPVY